MLLLKSPYDHVCDPQPDVELLLPTIWSELVFVLIVPVFWLDDHELPPFQLTSTFTVQFVPPLPLLR